MKEFNIPLSVKEAAKKLSKVLGLSKDETIKKYLGPCMAEIDNLKSEYEYLENDNDSKSEYISELENGRVQLNKKLLAFVNSLDMEDGDLNDTDIIDLDPASIAKYAKLQRYAGLGVYATGNVPIELENDIEVFITEMKEKY